MTMREIMRVNLNLIVMLRLYLQLLFFLKLINGEI